MFVASFKSKLKMILSIHRVKSLIIVLVEFSMMALQVIGKELQFIQLFFEFFISIRYFAMELIQINIHHLRISKNIYYDHCNISLTF